MSFDSHSLKKLQKIASQLPQPLPNNPPSPNSKYPNSSKPRHIVETEEDPEKLFKELIKVSPDGNVPPHLMARLKEAELSLIAKNRQDCSIQGKQSHSNPHIKNNESTLYVDFKRLLLEEDDAD